MTFLGLPPPEELRHAATRELLAWGVANWHM
jgi:hypothetical protein